MLETFEKIYNQFGSFILDSANNIGQSFIGWDPLFIISACDGENPFEKLENEFHKNKNHPEFKGIFGYISYDAAWHLEKLPNCAKNDLELPTIYFIAPRKLEIIKHAARKTAAARLQLGSKNVKLKSNFSKREFEEIVKKAKEYIKNGDIYQANLSQRLETDTEEHPFHIYKRLREINPSPFASYFNFGDFQIVSCSPERLIKLEKGVAQTRPIAGTRPITATEDELLLNPKERAEHIMLVDLERNDLGRACEYGSVQVDEKMVIEKYSHVIHIVSNVVGNLRHDKNHFDLLKAMFPGGTITGCPKIRSMEIIEELEPVKRGIYTGSIGYILPDGTMDFNIVIRTIIMTSDMGPETSDRPPRNNPTKAYIQVGAGIVADSDPEKEYYETLDKAQAMLEALK